VVFFLNIFSEADVNCVFWKGATKSASAWSHFLKKLTPLSGRLGKAEGITVVAHKLARVVYTLIKVREPYDEKTVQRRAKHLQTQAEKLGLKLVSAS